LCVISYCVLRMPEYHKLLNECILRHDQILLRLSELLKDPETANFVVKVTNDFFFLEWEGDNSPRMIIDSC
jgi:hypothetical protein